MIKVHSIQTVVTVLVVIGSCLLASSIIRFAYFLSGYKTFSEVNGINNYPISSSEFYCKTIFNWLLASSYLFMPTLAEFIVYKVGNICRLPKSFYKFTELVFLSSYLNVIIICWQRTPEIYLWSINSPHTQYAHVFIHICMWTMSIMILWAIDIMEITGLRSIFYYLLGRTHYPLKSQRFDLFLKNIAFPGSSCLIVILWTQKYMRLVLAVTWTLCLISCNNTDEKDIAYVSKQIEKKKKWMFYSECITVSSLE
ncbi:nurim isoform X2 [Daktulosphaira vitifoliae]|uniref:nurim isoform X2 n=1 Tax=Daktulosphaira vitifoliae TaxID=58002 RepID=UPI0021AA9295|nr:nurim isoform X2 [Daktulosphaira vitifoliae]